MITYSLQTREGCPINCDVQGHHVAAGLDELLSAIRGDWHREPGRDGPSEGLVIPYLADGLIVHLSTMKAVAIVEAAERAGCMPGMIMEALVKIKARALYWHNKALRYEASELRKCEKHSKYNPPAQQAPENEGDSSQEHVTHEIYHGKANTVPSDSQVPTTEKGEISLSDGKDSSAKWSSGGKTAVQSGKAADGHKVVKRRTAKAK